MSDKKPWAVFVQPPAVPPKNFSQQELVKAMVDHMAARAGEIRAEFDRSGMADQIEIGQAIPALNMLAVKATPAAVDKLKKMTGVVHSVEPNVFTAPMPEEDRRLLDERRRKGLRPNKGPRP